MRTYTQFIAMMDDLTCPACGDWCERDSAERCLKCSVYQAWLDDVDCDRWLDEDFGGIDDEDMDDSDIILPSSLKPTIDFDAEAEWDEFCNMVYSQQC